MTVNSAWADLLGGINGALDGVIDLLTADIDDGQKPTSQEQT